MVMTGENGRTRRKTCPSAALSIMHLTWADVDASPGLRGDGIWHGLTSTHILLVLVTYVLFCLFIAATVGFIDRKLILPDENDLRLLRIKI
jgi:hypothetical protein